MPTYDYECDSCGETVEVFHSMNDKPQVKCPSCSGNCHKVVSSFYLGGESAPSTSDMKKDLLDNHGIDQIQMVSGTFKDFYKGVKKDANRVKEEMIKSNETAPKREVKKLSVKEAEKRAAIIKENKAKKDYAKRKVSI